jgi:hypothetical protein
MLDLVGIEPTTSSMPFPSTKYSDQIASDSERSGKGSAHADFAHVRCPHLYTVDTPRQGAMRIGMGRDRRVTTEATTQVPTYPPALKQGWITSDNAQASCANNQRDFV